MSTKKKNLKSRNVRFRGKKINLYRSSIVVLCGLCALTALGVLGWNGYRYAHQSLFGRKPIVLENGETLTPVNLQELKPEVQDVLDMKNLKHLRSDIQTYMFNNQLSDLKDQINNYLAENNIDPSDISWAVQDLSTGAYTESDNASENFAAASTYKLPLCMLWYEKIADGTASMTDTFVLTDNMLEKEDEENPDQPIGRKYKIGDKIPLSELLEAAALYSDNIAGHVLFENLGGYSAYKTMALKYSDKLQDKDFTDGSKNVLNAHYMMNLVNYLYNTPGTFNDLKFWLREAATGFFLNMNYPLGYIQKIGNLEEVRNAVGLMTGQFPFSISIYSKIGASEGEKVIGDLGLMVYDYFLNKYDSGFYDPTLYDRNVELSQISSLVSVLSPYADSDFNGESIAEIEKRKEEEKKQQAAQQNAAEQTQPDPTQTPAESADPAAETQPDPAQTESPADPSAQAEQEQQGQDPEGQ